MSENTPRVRKEQTASGQRPAGYARSNAGAKPVQKTGASAASRPVQKTGAAGSNAAQGAKRTGIPTDAKRRAALAARAAAKRKQKQKKNILTIVIVLVLALIVGIGAWAIFRDKGDPTEKGGSSPVQTAAPENTQAATSPADNDDTGFAFANIETEDNTLPMSGAMSVKIADDDLSVTPGLDPNWLNVLLLGTDARTLSEPARTDTMIICSINKNTGDVKLTSIMRDTNVFFEGYTKNGTRINNAFFYGGPNLAMKVVNETFGMNIEKYVCVNFDGFAVIAEKIGGVDLVITENEKKHINKNVMEQYHILIDQGKIDYDVAEKEYFDTLLREHTTDGNKIHLNGMQTLGYARIRKLDSDYGRTERQRTVLNALMSELKECPMTQLISTAGAAAGYFSTNLSLTSEILPIAQKVLQRSNFELADQMHLPVAGTYYEGVRNEDARLWDVDINANTRALHDFIYND